MLKIYTVSQQFKIDDKDWQEKLVGFAEKKALLTLRSSVLTVLIGKKW